MSRLRSIIAALAFSTVVSLSFSAIAGEYSSDWQDNPYARARLISTGYPDAKMQTANTGLQIELEPGWKTYWRIPGDSGIPPQVKWDGSKNVKSIEVLWPAPHRFIDKYGMSIGYKNEIVLPVNVVPKDKTAPVHLALKLNYAVCAEVCLPASASMSLDIDPGNKKAGPFKRKLQRYVEQVPKTSTKGLSVQKLEIAESGKKLKLSFEVNNPAEDKLVDVFVEGGDTLYFGTPDKIVQKGVKSLVEFTVSGAKSAKELEGHKLRFTLVGKKTSADQYWTIGG